MKGISPLIAVIMLIAFVLVVSGIFYSWVSQFTYSQREEFQMCSRARIVVHDAYYNQGTGNINIVVYNTGDVLLKGFTVLVSSGEARAPEVVKFLEKEIQAKDIGLFTVEHNEDIDSMVVQSVECKSVQDMIRIYDVEGL